MRDNMIRFLENTTTSVTIAKGEVYKLVPEGPVPIALSSVELSSSQPEDVRVLSDGRIEGIKAGTATVTVKYAAAGRTDKSRIYLDKVNVSVVEPAYYFSDLAASMLPICITDEYKTILRERLQIVSCRDLLDNAERRGVRGLVNSTGASDFTVRLWIRQAALFEIDGMETNMALLAALAGIRNAEDLSKADPYKLRSAFDVAVPNAKAIKQDFAYPDDKVIDQILVRAKQMIPISDHKFSLVVGEDPAPKYLFRNEKEKIQQGLEILNHITLALPLPRVIRGYVVLTDNKDPKKKDALSGCKVSVSGVANPARDRSEDDQDLFAYTDEYGQFIIVMPEKYNLQECVTFTVTYEDPSVLPMTLLQGSQRVRTMTFVKRASEIMDAEYVEVIVSDKKTEEIPARQILADLDRIRLLQDEINEYRSQIENKLFSQTRLDEQKALLEWARHEYMELVEALRGEIIYHKSKYETDLFFMKKELDKTVEQLAGEILFHLTEQLQIWQNNNTPIPIEDKTADVEAFVRRCYEKLIGRGPDAAGVQFWVPILANGEESPEVMVNRILTMEECQRQFNIQNDIPDISLVSALYRVYMDREATKKEINNWERRLAKGATLQEVNKSIASSSGLSFAKTYTIKMVDLEQERLDKISSLETALKCSLKTLKKIIRKHLNLPELEDSNDNEEDPEVYNAMVQYVCTEHYAESLWACEQFHNLKGIVERLVSDISMNEYYLSKLYTNEAVAEEAFKRVCEEHQGQCGECEEEQATDTPEEVRLGRDGQFYHMCEDLSYNALEECELFQDKLTRYKETLKELEKKEKEYAAFIEEHKIMEEEDQVEAYCEQFIVRDKDGKPQKHYLYTNPDRCRVTEYSDELVQKYKTAIEEQAWLLETIYYLDVTTNDIGQTIRNFLSSGLSANIKELKINRDRLSLEDPHPRALPSVRLMGEGNEAVYLPTDTAPSRVFNYSMLQRLVEPDIARNDTVITRQDLRRPIDVMQYKEDLYNASENVPVATSLGIGYMLNMHQAWVPDGFALGTLLYSLVLAPGEEQRLIIRERDETYTVSDEAMALDTIDDHYQNNQTDNETAAFHQAANRFSGAHSDYSYTSTAKSKGSSGIHLFFGLGASSKATSVNSGSGSSNASQVDNYDEVSSAAQGFQTEIKTESNRLASAKRASIRVASSKESDSVSSKIIANHNHSHVMTVQYWEVTRRYRMETAIESIELVLFVPLKVINFLPRMDDEPYFMPDNDAANKKLSDNEKKKYGEYLFPVANYKDFTKRVFAYRYGNLLRYSDALMNALPSRFRGGLKLIREFSAYPEWNIENTINRNDTMKIKVKGNLIEADQLTATLCFQNGATIEGSITENVYQELSASLNTRRDVVYGLKQIRMGKNVKKVQKRIGEDANINRYVSTDEKEGYVIFTFYLPPDMSRHDISHITLENNLTDWDWRLSQETEYMEDSERIAIKRYEHWKYNYSHDNDDNSSDMRKIQHYQEGLPECYTDPIVHLSRNELLALGTLRIKVYAERANTNGGIFNENISIASGRLQGGKMRISMGHLIPTLGYDELMEIEDTLHHIVSQTLHYSQVVWSSLSDNERIMMLEQYNVNIDSEMFSSAEESGNKVEQVEPLLNCVNAKKLLGFYGNCMLLPFTFPKSIAEKLHKTAAEVQDELYRYHTTNFRVPSTVISVPTDGMVGEAVLGATNVSEKIDITRFWNWKDSDIDHIDINQNYFSGHSLLDNADTKSVDAPTVGVTPTEHIAGSNLAAALMARQQPTFADALANTDLRNLLMSTDKNASTGRESIVAANTDMVKSTINAATDIAKAVATGGVSLAGDALGDTDVIKSALTSMGISEGDADALVKKLSSGKMNQSDVLQNVANAIKKKGETKPPAETDPGKDPEDGGGGENPSQPGPEGELSPTDPEVPAGEPNPENPEDPVTGEGQGTDTNAGDGQDGEKNEKMEQLFNRIIESMKNGENAVDFFNREYKSPTGEPLTLDEIIQMADKESAEVGYTDGDFK